MSARAPATDLREALIAETLDEVARLHDAVQAIGPALQAAVADATAHGKKEMDAYAQAQALFVEQTMLQDREKFIEAQKEALEALRKQIKVRESWLTSLAAEIIKKVQAHTSEEGEQAAQKARVIRKKRQYGMFFGMFLGMLLTFVGVIGASWANAVWVCGR